MSRIIRSWLYCPAHQLDIVTKASNSSADAIVIDLEDAVPAGAKDLARENLVVSLRSPSRTARWVRINPLDSPSAAPDLAAVIAAQPDGVRIAKCESVDAVRRFADAVRLPVSLIIETALGLELAYELASAHPLVSGISLGEADLKASLRVDGDVGLDWARGRIVTAARAAGLSSPSQSVYTQVSDLDGLRQSTEAARRAGFFGRSVIHPRQIEVVNAVFTPTDEQVNAARSIVRQLEHAQADNRAAVLDEGGAFIDPAVAERAAFIVQLHEQLQKESLEMERR